MNQIIPATMNTVPGPIMHVRIKSIMSETRLGVHSFGLTFQSFRVALTGLSYAPPRAGFLFLLSLCT